MDIKRIDLIDPFVSGNKWFKLKYNLIEAKKKYGTILTFGGLILIILLQQLMLLENMDLEVLAI